MGSVTLGVFSYIEEMVEAASRLKSAGYEITVYSPVPIDHEIEHVVGEKKSNDKYLTLAGGLVGFTFGVILALGTSALYVLPRGGRPIWAIPPTLIISYETTILLGVLFTLLAFIFFKRLPKLKRDAFVPDVAIDSFGLLIEGIKSNEFEYVEKTLLEFGAKEVKRIE